LIARLKGLIADKGIDSVVIDVGGVGYEVRVSLRALQALPPVAEPAEVHVHTHVREDAIVLYGFQTHGAKRLFRRLIGVSGLGPKLALNALSVYTAAELQSAITTADVPRLTRIAGVGKKTAQRVALELGDKLGDLDLGGGPTTPHASATLTDLRGALQDLGFTQKQSDTVITALEPSAADGASIEALLKEALALLRS